MVVGEFVVGVGCDGLHRERHVVGYFWVDDLQFDVLVLVDDVVVGRGCGLHEVWLVLYVIGGECCEFCGLIDRVHCVVVDVDVEFGVVVFFDQCWVVVCVGLRDACGMGKGSDVVRFCFDCELVERGVE